MKTILKQDSNSRQRQDIVCVSNLKARKIKTLLSLPIHLAHHRFAAATVTPLSLRCLSAAAAVAPAVSPSVAPAFALLSLLMLLCCCSAVAPISLRYQSAVAPLLLRCRCCHSCCRSAVSPAVAPIVAPAAAWIVHGCRLKKQNQGNGCHWLLSGACVFLPITEFGTVENSQGGNLITLYSSIERS